jgi:CRP-like cAMP-binding protein
VSPKSSPSGNSLLAALRSSDSELLRSDMEPLALEVRHSIEEPNKVIRHVYFLDAGIASVVATIGGDKDIEIGIIGREGVTGASVIMGNDRSPHCTYIQVAGRGRRISVAKLRAAMSQSITLQTLLMKSVFAFNVQTAHTAVANARGSVEQRLARWLLMAHDRIDGDDLALTHEFLSLMLAVRRAGVTVALSAFEQRNLIRRGRSQVTIIDREGIEEIAGDFYGVPENELERLIERA